MGSRLYIRDKVSNHCIRREQLFDSINISERTGAGTPGLMVEEPLEEDFLFTSGLLFGVGPPEPQSAVPLLLLTT